LEKGTNLDTSRPLKDDLETSRNLKMKNEPGNLAGTNIFGTIHFDPQNFSPDNIKDNQETLCIQNLR
jgi:hypothetical protein